MRRGVVEARQRGVHAGEGAAERREQFRTMRRFGEAEAGNPRQQADEMAA